ncbi:MAG: hypothetical protein ACK4FF_10360 [Limnobacter sp.]|uniref:hypothetical protein n=1 Tax=Limnobacter sp. TaxID=2003368 RepID=UPI00391D1FC7
MNKRLLSRLMHERVSALQSSAGYFFRGDFEYVLKGVAFEYVPRGLYIWEFRFPLFDFFGPNLLYSTRLSERAGFIGKGEMSEEAIVDFVMSSPEARSAFGSDKSEEVPEFVHFLESAPDLLRNAHARLIHAAALLLVGQESRATSMLDELAPVLNEKDAANCNLLRTSLRQGLAAARTLLDQVRRENLRTLGLAV